MYGQVSTIARGGSRALADADPMPTGRIARGRRLTSRWVRDDVLVLAPHGDPVKLSGLAAQIWQALMSPCDLRELTERVARGAAVATARSIEPVSRDTDSTVARRDAVLAGDRSGARDVQTEAVAEAVRLLVDRGLLTVTD